MLQAGPQRVPGIDRIDLRAGYDPERALKLT